MSQGSADAMPVRPAAMLTAGALIAALGAGAATAQECAPAGRWFVPASAQPIATDRLLEGLADRSVVLLGEVHDDPEHHRWQLHTVAALHGRNPNLVLAFEAFPRAAQPALDRWVRGELGEAQFLAEANWQDFWGYPAALYMPLFHFARQNRVPMVALNVSRELVARVGREGWVAVPEDTREGITTPAPPSAAYRRRLAQAYAEHPRDQPVAPVVEGGEVALSPEELAEILTEPEFRYFTDAQLTWDRAMAEAVRDARLRPGARQVIAIAGTGHLEHGDGIPRQLADLGIDDAAVLLPVTRAPDCSPPPADLADAVFLLQPQETPQEPPQPPRPRLGVAIEDTQDGVRVVRVLEGSVAEAASLAPGDIILEAAGAGLGQVDDLLRIVRRQTPGTWLPLTVRRDGETREIVAKFPPEPAR